MRLLTRRQYIERRAAAVAEAHAAEHRLTPFMLLIATRHLARATCERCRGTVTLNRTTGQIEWRMEHPCPHRPGTVPVPVRVPSMSPPAGAERPAPSKEAP